MKFTGERFLPDDYPSEDIAIEHYQRYLSIPSLVKGKTVVDAACGEGYGASIIGEVASFVYGIDIDGDTIRHAAQKYAHISNLKFINAPVASLPLRSRCADVVVSFETIEHVDETNQHLFLSEIKRILTNDGVLVISTPDKFIYSDSQNYTNEFHIKEFYKDEFYDFLLRYFKHVTFFYQDFQAASLLSNERMTNLNVVHSNKMQGGRYIVAICSDVYEKTLHSIGSVVYDIEDTLAKKTSRILELQREVEQLGSWGKHLDAINVSSQEALKTKEHFIQNLRDQLHHLTQKVDEFRQAVVQRDSQLAGKNQEIDRLRDNSETLVRWIQDIERDVTNLINSWRWKVGNCLIGVIDLFLFRFKRKKASDHIWWTLNQFHSWYHKYSGNSGDAYKTMIEDTALKNIEEGTKGSLLFTLLRKAILHPRLTCQMLTWERLRNFVITLRQKDKNLKQNVFDFYIQLYSEHDSPVEKRVTKPREDIDLTDLVIDQPSEILASIIIYAHNNWQLSARCIASILHATQNIGYEIILADDNSTDETPHASKGIKGLKVSKNASGLGYLKMCNKTSEMAEGKYVVFLHNDTQVKENWLENLVSVMEQDSTFGMVGPKLLFPDGRLQESGGVVWKDGRLMQYGRTKDPEMPEYNYLKEADYSPGACFMIRKDLWDNIGGFDGRYSPAYYENVDLSFEVRKRGFKVINQPKSIVLHAEDRCYGCDGEYDLRNYQEINREKFVQKWSHVLESHLAKGEDIFHARDRSKNKQTILVIDHYVPHFDKDAGSKTVLQYLSLLARKGFNVKFIGDNYYRHEPYTTVLQQLGIEVLYGPHYANNWKGWFRTNASNFQYILMNRPHISIKYIDFIKNHSKAKRLYYGHDLHYLRESRRYEYDRDPETLESLRKWKAIELDIFRKSDVIYYPSEVEVEEINKVMPEANVRAIPAYIYADAAAAGRLPVEETRDLMFVGGFGHPPNADAVSWFLKDCFPLVLRELPNVKFYVIGSNPPNSILKLASKNVILKGFVTEDELVGLYGRIRLVVVPLRYGAGIKGKIVEAIYYNVPIITTSVGAEGLYEADKVLSIEDTAEGFAKKILELYSDIDFLTKQTQEFPGYIVKYFSEESALRALKSDIDFE